MSNTNIDKKPAFGMRDCVAYAAGDLGCNMSFGLKGTMAIFWTQYMQMDLWYSLLLIIVQFWDAVNDPLIGSIIDGDRRRYKRNKFLQYIHIGSIGLIVGGACCFVPLPNASVLAKGIIFVAGYVIWDAFYTIANVPYGSLLSLISGETADRASLSAWRSVGSILGTVLPMVLLPFIIYDSDNNLIGERVFWVALLMGGFGFVCFQFMLRNTTIRVEVDTVLREEQPKFDVIRAVGNFLHNRPAVGATVAAMGLFLGLQGASTAVTVLFQSYFHNVKVSGLMQLFAGIPIVVFTPLARKLVTKYGKKELGVVGALCALVFACLMLVLPITPDFKGIALYVLCYLFIILGTGVYSTVSWGMMGDAIDYNEWKHGSREEGTVYALHSFFRKLSQGVFPALALVVMVAMGYVGENEGNQTAEVALRMRYLVPAIYIASASMMAVGLGLVYNLDRATTEQMAAELEEQRKI